MHAVIIDHLEEYLSGSLPPSAQHRFEAHLEACGQCRREIEEMQEACGLLASFKPAEVLDPSPEFVAKVMLGVAADPAPSFWSPFRDFAFARRVVFASLLTLAVLGTVLVTREQAYAPAPTTPEAVMADGAGAPNSDQMLVTLANYEP
jgi:anti-sigma factor RsiW